MTPEVQIAVVGGIGVTVNAISLIIVALIQSRASLRNHAAINAVGEKVSNVSADVQRVETNTNSLSQKVELAAGVAGELRGRAAEVAERNVDRTKT